MKVRARANRTFKAEMERPATRNDLDDDASTHVLDERTPRRRRSRGRRAGGLWSAAPEAEDDDRPSQIATSPLGVEPIDLDPVRGGYPGGRLVLDRYRLEASSAPAASAS